MSYYKRKKPYYKRQKQQWGRGINRNNVGPRVSNKLEKKTVGLQQISVDIVTAGTMYHLTPIAVGDTTEDDRTGQMVTCTWLHMNGVLNNLNMETSSTVKIDNVVRLVIFADLNNTGTLPTTAELMDNATVYSVFNPYNRNRFKILYDKFWSLPACQVNDTVGAYGTTQAFKISIPLKNIQTRFTGTSSDSYGPGCIFALWIAHRDGYTANQYSDLSFNSQIKFIDA